MTRITLQASLIVALVTLTACSPAPEPTVPADAAAAADSDGNRTARTLQIPGAPQQLPTDHPPIGSGGATRLVWSVPDGWTEEVPASSMRIAQFRVDGEAGPGECVVYYFGPGQGGDPRSNAMRWANQFTQPDGRPSPEVMRVVDLDGTQVTVRLVEVTGTYDGGMTMTDEPAKSMDNYMLLGGIADGPDAPWFFKFTGPEATIRAQTEAFVEMMRSLHPGA